MAVYVTGLPWVVSQKSLGHLQGKGRVRMSRSHRNQLLPGRY